MFGSAISRWTMLHFGVALAFFVLAQFAMAAGGAFPATALSAPTTLATVHLLTIGWLTVLMLGALHQFIPVITAQGEVAGLSALVSLIAIVLGLGGMEAGFLTLNGDLPPPILGSLRRGGPRLSHYRARDGDCSRLCLLFAGVCLLVGRLF